MLAALPLDPISRISPSVYQQFLGCKLKGLWTANKLRPLLPLNPAARLGIVIHKVLERSMYTSEGGKEDFEGIWAQEEKDVEELMLSSPLEKHFVPLSKNTHKYTVKKIRCRNIFNKNISSIFTGRREGMEPYLSSVECERYLETDDGKIAGTIDKLVTQDDSHIIVDYKSGIVKEPHPGLYGEVREDYKNQLKFYAALYYQEYGKWPTGLLLVSLSGNEYEVSFTPTECNQTLDAARQVLEEVNKTVKDYDINTAAKILASPSPENCKFCLYRPACKAYWSERLNQADQEWPCDLMGRFISKEKSADGTILIRLMLDGSDDESVYVRGVDPSEHQVLSEGCNGLMAIYSLKPDWNENGYRVSRFTTTYCEK